MKLLAHLVRADIRQFRWALLLWTLLVVSETAVVASRPSFGGNRQLYGNVGMLAGLLWWALQLGMLVLVPLIVHAHPAVGTDAFWMTRPVPPRTLFAAKALLLGVLTVVLYSVARLVLMLWTEVPAREALFVTLDTAISSTAWLAVLMAGAAVTLNLSRFALLCGAVLLSFVLLSAFLIMRASTDAFQHTATLVVAGSAQPTLPPVEDPTAGLLFTLSVAAAGFGLATMQYRTRRRRISVPVAIAALILAGVASANWPLPLLRVRSVLPPWANQPDALQLRASSPVIEHAQPPGWFGTAGPRLGTTPVSLSGIEPDWVPRLELLGASLTLDNGTTVASGTGYQSLPPIATSPEVPTQAVARSVLGVDQVFGTMESTSEPAVMLTLPAGDGSPPANARGLYRGHFAVRLAHWEAVATAPLRTGSVFQDDSYRFTIEKITAGPGNTLSVRGREWSATSSFDRKPDMTYTFYVRNAQRSRAMEGQVSEPFEGMASLPASLGFSVSAASPGRFFVRTAIASFPARLYGPPDTTIDWDPAWYADADVVLVRVTQRGAVVRTLDIPGATLIAKQ